MSSPSPPRPAYDLVIGVDVAKATPALAAARWAHGDSAAALTPPCPPSVANDVDAAEAALRAAIAACGPDARALVCCEHTGTYTTAIIDACQRLGRERCDLWVVDAYTLARSAGRRVRAKTDPADAARIGDHARRHVDRFDPSAPGYAADVDVHRLAALRSRRRPLVTQRASLKRALDARASSYGPGIPHDDALMRAMDEATALALDASTRAIDLLDEAVAQLLEPKASGDAGGGGTGGGGPGGILADGAALLMSCPRVGVQLAGEILVATHGGTRLLNGHQLACHAGVVPFERSSGTSVRGRPRVSKHANAQLKALLHMAALGAIGKGGFMRAYYERKRAEGKHASSILNAIRAKIIKTAVACLRTARPYDPGHVWAAAG